MKDINPYPLAGHLLEANLRLVEREDWVRWSLTPPTVPPNALRTHKTIKDEVGAVWSEAARKVFNLQTYKRIPSILLP